MKPRILIFSIAYDPLIGGAELAVRNITDRLLSCEFDLITARFTRASKTFERIGNVNVYRVGFGSRLGRYLYPMFAFRKARQLHGAYPYQVVWSIMAAYAGAAALMFLRRFPGVKFLLTLQEGDPIVHIHRRVRGMKKMWQRIFRRADYIQAISRYLADWARAEGATCPVEIVPNGVDVKNFTPPLPPPHEGGRKGGSMSQITKIITTSRLVRKNGIDILIKAAAELKIHIPHSTFHIQIAGSGPEEKKLKDLTKKLGLEGNIEFLGDVPNVDVPEYLSQADIFVRPSRSEGLGSSFLEAMAAGLPVIGTAVGGIVDFLIPYKSDLSPSPSPGLGRVADRPGEVEREPNGLFVKPEDPQDLAEKIKLLMENDDLRTMLGQSGRKLAEDKYDWNKIAEQMNIIFQKLCVS